MNRTQRLFTKLNLHFAALGVVLVVLILIGVRVALAWRGMRANQTPAFAQQQIHYGQLLAQMQHLNGLPEKVQAADVDAQKFYQERVAPNYSTMVAELMGTAAKDKVRLARSAYAPEPAIPGVTAVRIDAGLSGEYTDVMHFINDLERDRNHVFFIIDGVTLTGQQGGLVNLRLKVTTFLRSDAADLPASEVNAAETQETP